MTRINKLVMHGFKSFARRTELVFGEQFNCVLGPNGSGKSNILDALCFVLGRLGSKSLRAEKSGNLVYNGGKLKKPMKQGEVSIFFDNEEKTFPTEEPYVKITRIIKDSGQSIYKINDQKCTRQQILDMMAIARINPDGYNIILQGDIISFTEMHPEERRLLIEEIAGISVYEDKKQKALRELEKVDEKLKEAGVILAERKKYLDELGKEKEQAEKFKETEGKVKESKASYTYIQMQKEEKKKNKLSEETNEHKGKLDDFNKQINDIKQVIDNKKKEIDSINKEIEEKGEKEQVSMQREIEALKVEIATGKTKKDGFRTEVENIELRKKNLEKDMQDIDNQINELKSKKEEKNKEKDKKVKELEKINSKINKFKEDNSIADAAEIETKIEEFEKDIEEKQKEIEKLKSQQQDLIRKKDSLQYQINSVDERVGKVKQIEKEYKDKIEELKNKKEELKTAVSELNKRLNEDSSLALQIDESRRKLSAAQEELAKLNARNASIREHASRSIAVNSIIEKKWNGVYGTIASLGNVNSKYSKALEVAAGPRINSLVVEDDKIAADCIKHLKKNKLGIATFLPLNKIKSKDIDENIKELAKKEGVHGLAIDLVSFDPKFKKVFSYVFGSTMVVEDIDTARKIGIGSARMVSLDGDLAEASGAMQGGFRKKEGSGFKEKEVIKGIEDKNQDILEYTETLSVLGNRRQENEAIIDQLRNKRAELEGEIIKGEKSLHLESGDIEASEKIKQDLEKQSKETDDELEKLGGNIDGFVKEITRLKMDKQALRERVNNIRNPSLLAELNSFEEKRNSLTESMIHTDAEIRGTDNEINSMKLPEKEKIKEILKQQAKDADEFSKKIEKLSESIAAMEKDLAKREETAKDFYAKYRELFSKRTKIGDTITADERNIEKLQEEAKQVELKMNELSIINAEVKGKLAGLEEDMKQYEGVKINTEKSEKELKEDIAKFERMVIEIGSVNMRALEVYEEIEKEYNSLLGKKEKLILEKDEVIKMMDEIEGKKKALFMESFDVVNENFKRFFSALSTKGDASLVLEDPENPFEAGLNIKVRLTGQKFLDIRSLSGGEKTMTALAFIFAIQEHEPHSFYIMDEVDAALDKHNSVKLAKLIRDYCKKAQYIVISHNDQLISEADILYGVSMDTHGITKVTSLKI